MAGSVGRRTTVLRWPETVLGGRKSEIMATLQRIIAGLTSSSPATVCLVSDGNRPDLLPDDMGCRQDVRMQLVVAGVERTAARNSLLHHGVLVFLLSGSKFEGSFRRLGGFHGSRSWARSALLDVGYTVDVTVWPEVTGVGRKRSRKMITCCCLLLLLLRPGSWRLFSGDSWLLQRRCLGSSSRVLQDLHLGGLGLAGDSSGRPETGCKVGRKSLFSAVTRLATTSRADSGEPELGRRQRMGLSSRGLRDLQKGTSGSAWDGRGWPESAPENSPENCKKDINL